jgi:hypothetical protein
MLAILLLSCAFGCNQERHQFNAPGTLAAPLAVPDRIDPVEAILAGGTAKRIRDAGYDPRLLDNSRKMSSEFYMVDIGVDPPSDSTSGQLCVQAGPESLSALKRAWGQTARTTGSRMQRPNAKSCLPTGHKTSNLNPFSIQTLL